LINREVAVSEALCLLERGKDSSGICMGCGDVTEGVDPDAEMQECEVCFSPLVFGAEQLVLFFAKYS
jgi:hypothetical protein|tara:strand:- start:217 stop:417 length:201 start_codon:yes stop_codon:yes gene_type:complete